MKFAILWGMAALTICAADKPIFEVASIKVSPPPTQGARIFPGTRGGPGTADPERITSSYVTLKSLLMAAYDVKDYQISGPDWLETAQYDLLIKVPPGATKEQARAMWQNLLADRFGVVLHHESKEFKVQELVAGKGGPKLTVAPEDKDAPLPSADPAPAIGKLDQNGVPVLTAPGFQEFLALGLDRITGKSQPLSRLAISLGNSLRIPVVDKTGLAGLYDFTLKYARARPLGNAMAAPPEAVAKMSNAGDQGRPQPDPMAAPAGATLDQALQEQLGLKLQSGKANLDVLVIDSANKTPTGN